MKNQMTKKMKNCIEKILSQLGVLEKFMSVSSAYVKVSNEGYMPLSIEKHEPRIIITHYFELNGDLIPDPDMEFEMTDEGWLPIAIQHSSGAYFRCTFKDEFGNIRVNRRERINQKEFADMWASNLMAQGFGKGKIERQSWD